MTLPAFVHDFDRWWSMNWEYGEVNAKPGAFHLIVNFFLFHIYWIQIREQQYQMSCLIFFHASAAILRYL